MEGLRKKAFKEKRKITVTDIQPGFVDTDLIKGSRAFGCRRRKKPLSKYLRRLKKRNPMPISPTAGKLSDGS